MTASHLVAGFMSGTSLDGVDVAVIDTDGYLINNRVAFDTFGYSSLLKEKVKSIFGAVCYDENIKSIENELTEIHYQAILDLCDKHQLNIDTIQLFGFHGQTIYHKSLLLSNDNNVSNNNNVSNENKENEEKQDIIKGTNCETWQIGNAKLLFDKLKIPIVYNLRYNDILNGGQGAPLAPIYHAAIVITKFIKDCKSKDKDNKNAIQFPVVFVNIGGISNVTLVDIKDKMTLNNIDSKLETNQDDFVKSLYDNLVIKAFDVGPGNCILDDWINLTTNNSCDYNGMYSLNGTVNKDDIALFIDQFMSHPYFNLKPPKSLDRNDLHQHLWKILAIDKLKKNCSYIPMSKICNIAQIIAECTCHAIIDQIIKYCCNGDKDCIPNNWFICGGGRNNPFIMKNLRKYSKMKIMRIEEIGYDGDSIEAEAWAFLAARSKQKMLITFPETTGVETALSGGDIITLYNTK